MQLFRLMLRLHPRVMLVVLTLSVLSAGLSVLVIAFINDRLIRQGADLGPALSQYAILLIFLAVTTAVSRMSVTTLGHQLVCKLRTTLVKRILDTDMERLEAIGPSRLIASLHGDISAIAAAVFGVPAIVHGISLVLGTIAYLAWLSPSLFLATVGWLSMAVAVGGFLLRRTQQALRQARQVDDELYTDYQAVIEGRKELGLNRDRARTVYEEEFVPKAERERYHQIRSGIFLGLNESWIQTMVLAALGLCFFLSYGFGIGTAETSATYALVILFLRTPLVGIALAVPVLVASSIAIRKIDALKLGDHRPDWGTSAEDRVGRGFSENWRMLHLESVTYRYPGLGEEPGFAVGPVDLTLRRGKVVFIVGGNGSGKSTLARLLTGLYRPHGGGRIRVDDVVVERQLRGAYRRLFSTVFSDFFPFRQLLGPDGKPANDEHVKDWLRRLDISHKVSIEEGGRLVATELSHGQRKRVALLIALLEERPVLVLDEWAADQDPVFRRTFYTELVPALKAAGKTIVAITHDEHYFHVADQILRADEGRLVDSGFRHEARPARDVVRSEVVGS